MRTVVISQFHRLVGRHGESVVAVEGRQCVR